MYIIIACVIILWITVSVMIIHLVELNRTVNNYNSRIHNNFAQSYENKLQLNKIEKYIDDKAYEEVVKVSEVRKLINNILNDKMREGK